MSTYAECKAHCLRLLQEPKILRRRYASTEDLPEIVRDCWTFPAHAFSNQGLTQLVHVDGWGSPIIEELTIQGEQAAHMKYYQA